MKTPLGRPSSRERILDAAEALAHEVGPGNISLDAVAARAGLSKGGLLYNFPTKAKLLEALVEVHVERSQRALDQASREDGETGNALAIAYLHLCRDELTVAKPSAAGVFAAIAENPEFIAPIRRHHRKIVDQLSDRSEDRDMAMIAFVAVEGLRSLKLFESDCLSDAEMVRIMDRLDRELRRDEPSA